MTKETGFFLGAGGSVFEMDLPLPEVMQDQVTRRQLVRVANADGAPYVEPAAETEDEGPKRPAKNASKNDWVGYALTVDENLTVDDADAMSRDDLIEKYGK